MSGDNPGLIWNDHLGWERRWNNKHEPWPDLGARMKTTIEQTLEARDSEIGRLRDACEELKRLVRDYEIPEGVVRKYTSFEVAEYILNDAPLQR